LIPDKDVIDLARRISAVPFFFVGVTAASMSKQAKTERRRSGGSQQQASNSHPAASY